MNSPGSMVRSMPSTARTSTGPRRNVRRTSSRTYNSFIDSPSAAISSAQIPQRDGGTHLAGFYNWALDTGWALNIEHGLLIAGGLLFWWPLVSGRLSAPAALAYLGAAFVASSFLGLAFIFSSHPFYSFYEHAPRLWGFSAIRDQNLGGIAMNGEQTLVFLAAIGYYVSRLLGEESAQGR